MKPFMLDTRKRGTQCVVALLTALGCVTCFAEDLTLGALKAQGAQPLSKDDLSALLSGARLTREVSSGEVHINTLKDGSINADFKSTTRNSGQLRGFGNWKVTDDGKYCVDIKWNRIIEDVKGCRTMYKAGEDYYGAATGTDEEKPYHYKISK
jgi:Protein of unknown function (DUF995)